MGYIATLQEHFYSIYCNTRLPRGAELYPEAAATGLEATLVVENDHGAELNTKDDRCGAVAEPCGSDNSRSFDLIGKWNRPLESGVSNHESLLEYLEDVSCIPADANCELARHGF